MRHFLLILPALIATLGSSPTEATPVYLKLESRFPSGHHPRRWLETRTKDVQFQQWFRVKTKDSAYGWLPEDHLITSLHLASQAELTEDTPTRTEMDMDALGPEILPKKSKLIVIETNGSWVLAKPLAKPESDESWFPSSILKADLDVASRRAFLPAKTSVFVLPGLHARVQTQIKSSRFAAVVREQRDWLEVRLGSVGQGFVRRDDVLSVRSLGHQGARPLFDLAALRSAPLPYADLVRSLSANADLRILATRSLRWGQANIRDIGDIWWPITDEAEEAEAAALRERMTTSQIFKRKIFDMASSPAMPALKFVSAEGVFRTSDGREWTRIPIFQDKNYPIAIAGGGSIFIGPYLSDDHGETFQQWIRWDILISTLKKLTSAPRGLQILEIRPQDAAGRRVILKLNVGLESPVLVITDDQGISWRPVDSRK